jgi:hypothetical protein
MTDEMKKMICLSSISVSEPRIHGKTAKADITVHTIDGKKSTFVLMVRYEEPLTDTHLPLLRILFAIPLLNYGLFTKKFILQYPLSKADLSLFNDLNDIFSRDIFVNKIMKRRADYILPEFLPREKYISAADAKPKAVFLPNAVTNDVPLTHNVNPHSCGVLSSGGKESLLTYAMLKELGVEVHPLYVNESGGHWRTALTAYRSFQKTDPRTYRIWTNIDRFYLFMLDHLPFIRSDHRKVRADTYAIRLCVFPFYIFALLPVFLERKIGNVLLGSEFDDLRHTPSYKGLIHYYGVYDQEQLYDIRMLEWYAKRIPGMNQWSALRGISGLIVERILVSRYPSLAKLQRSCHSCHITNGEVIPCGVCSKCEGILLFLLANDADPRIMNYTKEAITAFPNNLSESDLRLDDDEKEQSFYLMKGKGRFPDVQCIGHVEQIHVSEAACNPALIPEQFRQGLLTIMEQYTKGYCLLKDEQWVPLSKSQLSSLVMRSASLVPSLSKQ